MPVLARRAPLSQRHLAPTPSPLERPLVHVPSALNFDPRASVPFFSKGFRCRFHLHRECRSSSVSRTFCASEWRPFLSDQNDLCRRWIRSIRSAKCSAAVAGCISSRHVTAADNSCRGITASRWPSPTADLPLPLPLTFERSVLRSQHCVEPLEAGSQHADSRTQAHSTMWSSSSIAVISVVVSLSVAGPTRGAAAVPPAEATLQTVTFSLLLPDVAASGHAATVQVGPSQAHPPHCFQLRAKRCSMCDEACVSISTHRDCMARWEGITVVHSAWSTAHMPLVLVAGTRSNPDMCMLTRRANASCC